MLPIMLASSLFASTAAGWYGPAVASFSVQYAGNPHDPAVNDVRVRFTGPSGKPEERLAYFDDASSTWRAILVTKTPGKYQATLLRNGVPATVTPEEGLLTVDTPLKKGFLQFDPIAPNRLADGTGKRYVPLGVNLGWQSNGIAPMAEQIAKMHDAGMNWTRIWACHWDGKNPWWPQEDPAADKSELWEPAIAKWQALVEACEKHEVAFQMVLFHHGAFSSRVNPNWPEHPWNEKNGGFLKDAADLFTDPEAKRRAKIWLRYAVARFAHRESLLAWELFNEVEWVDARYANRWPDIEAWHSEMAAYLRELDPYDHLITTSSATDRPKLWEAMDYVQPHVYAPDLHVAIVSAKRDWGKPGFYGEFGAENMGSADVPRVVRDGALAGLLANDLGPGQFWYWDELERRNLYPEFKRLSEVIEGSDFARHPAAVPLQIRVETAEKSALTLAPGLGWGETVSPSLNLPEDAVPAKLRGISSYVQGESNRRLQPKPITLRFRASAAGVAKVRLGTVARAGADLRVRVNGKEVAAKLYPARDRDLEAADILDAPFGPGEVVIELENVGPDWVRLNRIDIPGIASAAVATAIGDGNWAMLRLTSRPGAGKEATLVGLPFPDGEITVVSFDLDGKGQASRRVSVRSGRLTVPLVSDAILVLRAP